MDWSIEGVQEDRGKSVGGDDFKRCGDIEDVKSNFRIFLGYGSRNFLDFSSRDVVDAAIQGMLAHLDSQCALLSPEDLQKVRTAVKGKFTGIGAVITMKDGFVTVLFSLNGTPAHRAGIVAGDRIHRVNGIEVGNISDAVTGIGDGEGVILSIARKDMKNPVDYEILREVIPNKSVYALKLRSGFGYAWIGSFDENTARDLETALVGLDTENRPLRGLILDLRDNPGGLLYQAIQVSDLFLDKGNIVSVKGRIKGNTREFKARPDAVRSSFPVVVLMNENSASAAEIVASALQENNRAIVLGKTSLGKGSIQAVDVIGGGYGLKITIARYATPRGNFIQGRGVVPDVFIDPEIAGGRGRVISDESGLMDDPEIDIALLAMQRAHSYDVYDLLCAARNVMDEEDGKSNGRAGGWLEERQGVRVL
ncbi:MAG: S41 family peptidase, partial [Deltaproteobacteria bacterium]|nr:S41 family peptidase [Deltaproteobacteria bacterium]